MASELREKVAMLRAMAPGLNATTQRTDEIVTSIEAMLGPELNLGISAETTPFEQEKSGQDEPGRILAVYRSLAYGRYNSRFCIHVVEVVEVGVSTSKEGEYEWTRTSTDLKAWSSCPRGMRLKAFVKLPELLESIAARADTLRGSANKAATLLEGSLR